MNQNHSFIDALVELYSDLPYESDHEMAARRVAVLMDHLIDGLERESIPVTRETLYYQIQQSLAQRKKSA